jgi:hypothetical protein
MGVNMRLALLVASTIAGIAAAAPASAATVVVFTHPETFERRMVVVDPSGPDRFYMCMLPPGEAGCHRLRTAAANR